MGRAPCCSKIGLHRGAWSHKEDKLLTNFIQANGEGQWRSMPSKAGLLRCGKSCRLRWMNYLRPGIKRGSFTADENDIIIRLHSIHGNRWSFIATELCGRTDNEIKNHWNTHLKQKVHPDDFKKPKKPKKNKRKTDKKSDNVPQNTSSSSSQSSLQSTLANLGNEDGFDNGLTNGSDFSWPDWSLLFEMEGSATSLDELLDMPVDDLDVIPMNHDETEMLQKIYDECLHLI